MQKSTQAPDGGSQIQVIKFIKLLCTLSHVCPYRMETDRWSVKIVFDNFIRKYLLLMGANPFVL